MTEEQQSFIEILNPLNIEARYPEYKSQLLFILTQDKCTRNIIGTEELLCWIIEQL